MLYYLYELGEWARKAGYESDFFKALNVFSYITFRSICAASTAFLISIVFGNWTIRRLISLKFGQPIRTKDEVDKLFELHGAKKGTPTMGGVLIIGSILISTLLWARLENPFVWLVLFSTLFLGVVGFYDDWLKVTKKSSKGISSRLKLGLQCVLAGIFTVFFLTSPRLVEIAKQLYIPFFKEPVIFSLGWLTFVFYLLVIVGTSNAVNLTDGLDGLATGCTATVAAAYAALAYLGGNARAAEYLQIPYVPYSGELAVVCSALLGSCLGFLWWNASSGPCVHGRHRFARHRRNARRRGYLLQAGDPSHHRRGRVRHGGNVGHPAGRKLQDDRQAHHQDVTDPSPFRTQRLEGKYGDRPILDYVHPLCPAGPGHLEAAMIYSGKRAVVLGLGHSGEAAGILLREEGAEVTICESCDNPGLREKSSRLRRRVSRLSWAPRPIPTRLPMTSASLVQASIRPFRSCKTSFARKFP